jgi:hypothetical protein
LEKLNFHDTLRIYLPSLLFCGLIYLLCIGSLKDSSLIAIPALFIGLLLDSAYNGINRWYFNYLTSYYKWCDQTSASTINTGIKERLLYQFYLHGQGEIGKRLYHLDCSQISYICSTFLLRQYTSEKLFFFKSPKSYGILFLNSALSLSLVCIILILNLTNLLPRHTFALSEDHQLYLLITLGWTAFACFNISTAYYMRSLRLELRFWSFLTKENLGYVSDLICLIDHFKQSTSMLVQNTSEANERENFNIQANKKQV